MNATLTLRIAPLLFPLAAILVLFLSLPGSSAASSLLLNPSRSADTPEFNKIWDYRPALVTTVYARDGRVLGYLYREKRYPLDIDEMSPQLVKAFLAAEDSAFYEHEGVDLSAIFRALSKNITAGDIVQGGSTITQQVVKRLLLTSEKSYARKIKEALLAYRLEHQMSKNDILTIYLNEIFMGANAYGVEAAARTYFAKHARDLTLAEAAVLAGLPKAPTKYSPFRDPEAAKARQLYVLGRMLELNWITREEHDDALSQELVYKSLEDPSWTIGAYYLEEVRRWLIQNFSKNAPVGEDQLWGRSGVDAVYEAGLHVYTAIDLDHQVAAEHALRQGLEDSSKRRGWDGPLKHLQPDEFREFLASLPVPGAQAQTGERFKALVVEVAAGGAKVKLGGGLNGFVDVKTMGWCRTPNPAVAAQNAGKIRDARRVLAPGDVILCSLTAASDGHETLPLALEQRPKVQGALVSFEPPTGDLVALVGGYDFNDSQFNRATQAVRQPGSAFKPIVYSAAMDAGFSPASVVLDEPFIHVDAWTGKVWQPKNYSGGYSGPTMLCTALAKSRNLVTIRIAEIMGIKRVIARAKALGLVGDFQPYLPVSLGSVAVSPINLCQAYSAFARDGSYVVPRLVLSISNSQGAEIWRSKPESVPAISPQNAFVMASMLKEVIRRGTATRARVLNRPLAGKTGTTNDEQDAWFIGFSPYLLSGVYVGFDQLTPMGSKETGSQAALPIWLSYRQAVEEKYPIEDFPQPEGIYFQQVASDGYGGESETSSGYPLPFMANSETLYMDEWDTQGGDFENGLSFGNDELYYRVDERKGTSRPAVPEHEEYLLKQLF